MKRIGKDSQEHLRRTYGDVGMDIYMLIFTCSTWYGSHHNELSRSEIMRTTKIINLDENYMSASGVYTLKNIWLVWGIW